MTYYVAQTDENGVLLVEQVAENLDLDDVAILADTYPNLTYFEVRPTGIKAYVNDEPGDPNPGIIVDAHLERALTSNEARALAVDLLNHADHFDRVQREARFGGQR